MKALLEHALGEVDVCPAAPTWFSGGREGVKEVDQVGRRQNAQRQLMKGLSQRVDGIGAKGCIVKLGKRSSEEASKFFL